MTASMSEAPIMIWKDFFSDQPALTLEEDQVAKVHV